MTESLALLFILFFKIGAFSFGGGLAMLPVIFQTISEHGLMTAGEFANLVAISQVTPGPVVVNAATYVGFNVASFAGSLSATLGVTLPALVICMTATKFLDKFKENRIIMNVMKGIRPATIGLVASGVIFLAREMTFAPIPLIIFAATVVMSGKFKLNPIVITLIMAVAGGLLCG